MRLSQRIDRKANLEQFTPDGRFFNKKLYSQILLQ